MYAVKLRPPRNGSVFKNHHSVLVQAKFLYDHESYRQKNEMPNMQVENGISCPGKNIKI